MVKMANKKWSNLNNDFCIIFDKLTSISEVSDDGSISNQAFDFCSIDGLQEIMPMKTVDVIGVISQLGESESINLKSGGTKLRRHV